MNLILRFCLELAALAGIGIAAFQQGDGITAYILAIASVVFAATLWGVFNVPGDPSRSGHAPIPVSGLMRLTLELVILFGGSVCFFIAGYIFISGLHGALTVVHYAKSTDRLRWLLKR